MFIFNIYLRSLLTQCNGELVFCYNSTSYKKRYHYVLILNRSVINRSTMLAIFSTWLNFTRLELLIVMSICKIYICVLFFCADNCFFLIAYCYPTFIFRLHTCVLRLAICKRLRHLSWGKYLFKFQTSYSEINF